MNIYIAELDNKYKLHTFEKERLIDELPARDWQDVSSFCRVDSPISRELRPYEKLWHLNEEDWRQRTINSEEAKIIAEGIAAAQDRFASLYIKHDEIKYPPVMATRMPCAS